ncbi:putative IQ motif, EF-hand binding, BAG family molecular chaperone regulator/7/8 [Helianthus annuus]|nr:putative IQ motif, EF-hand binding, BAG family molecular chaperone regulator/7/8 [Helianthus annuus]
MGRFSNLDVIDYMLSESSSFPFHSTTELDLTLDLLNPTFPSLDLFSPFEDFHTVTDLIHVTRTTPFGSSSSRKLITRRRSSPTTADLYLKSLSDRVSALELGFDLAEKQKQKQKLKNSDRKYTWTAEINSAEKDGLDRKYKLTTEIKGGSKKEKSCKWTAEIKRKGDDVRKYTFSASTANAAGVEDVSDVEKEKEKNNNKKKDKKKEKGPRIVEIQSTPDHGALLLKQAFAKRVEKNKGKKKELSPQDAAMMIQMTFRAYLIRRSQALRALRELAIAKGKLKELRSLFNNFSYRRRVARDAEEKQRFSEKIIVLLLTVDAIEGADILVRSAKRSMVDELEAMLDVVDPQPGGGKSLSLRRRTFDMPDGVIQKEVAEGVAQVVRMIAEDDGSETFE